MVTGATAESRPLTLGVLICSYKRPDHLERCLEGLRNLTRKADDVIVVYRDSDAATRDWLAAHCPTDLPIRLVQVNRPGIVAARNTGHDARRTDILSSIDDDVVPHPDWLRRVETHFRNDPQLGGLGGRDHVHDGERFDERLAEPVGRLQWFGREIGNHHLGFGRPRAVQFLKGANMSYRAEAMDGVRFDTRLCGRRIEAHEDMGFSLAVWRRGWKLVYDPAVLVYHYAGRADKRAYSAVCKDVSSADIRDAAHNKVLALWPALSAWQRGLFAVWSMLVGTSVEPGLIQAIRFTRRLGLHSWRRFFAVQRGRLAAYLQIFGEFLAEHGPRASSEIAVPVAGEE